MRERRKWVTRRNAIICILSRYTEMHAITAAPQRLSSIKRFWCKVKEVLRLLPAEEREIEQEVRQSEFPKNDLCADSFIE